MPRGQHSIEIDASAQAVFDLIHNYDLRLQWDSMLREAKLLNGATVAAEGRAISVCRKLEVRLASDRIRVR